MKEIIVTGGRDYDDYAMVSEVLSLFLPALIIQGGCSGADLLARGYAKEYRLPCITVAADWEKHGKAAGPLRNKEMLKRYPNAIVLAFPGGKGTSDCIRQAVAQNRIVLEVHK